MKLSRVQVTNYRNVEDSGWFTLAQVTCLVGKNEAGKTAILQALAALNPHPATPVTLHRERDYPRRFLTEYARRHPEREAIVVRTEWLMTAAERAVIVKEFGEAMI